MDPHMAMVEHIQPRQFLMLNTARTPPVMPNTAPVFFAYRPQPLWTNHHHQHQRLEHTPQREAQSFSMHPHMAMVGHISLQNFMQNSLRLVMSNAPPSPSTNHRQRLEHTQQGEAQSFSMDPNDQLQHQHMDDTQRAAPSFSMDPNDQLQHQHMDDTQRAEPTGFSMDPSDQLQHQHLDDTQRAAQKYEVLFECKGTVNQLLDQRPHYQIPPGDLLVIFGNGDPKYGIIRKWENRASESRPALVENFGKVFQIPRELLEIQKIVGSGNFGKVYKGKFENKVVAIKEARAGSCSPEQFVAEAKIMMECKHENLVELHAIIFDRNATFIITEFLSNGSLLDYLRRNRGQRLMSSILMGFAIQVACGMSFLHSRGIIHRDLAARNVLIGDYYNAKVGDFGLARMIGDNAVYQVSQAVPLPWKWTAPEGFKDSFYKSSDVWSFGALLIEIVTMGEEPFPGVRDRQEINAEYHHPQQMKCPDDLYSIIQNCLKYEQGERPTFRQLDNMLRNQEVFSLESFGETLDIQ